MNFSFSIFGVAIVTIGFSLYFFKRKRK
ncbi:MAG: LPXTG cell wall anchor domain-containing protein [Candidatus Heimdallarchaeaceae archaeon]